MDASNARLEERGEAKARLPPSPDFLNRQAASVAI